jgi:hypothetical protein
MICSNGLVQFGPAACGGYFCRRIIRGRDPSLTLFTRDDDPDWILVFSPAYSVEDPFASLALRLFYREGQATTDLKRGSNTAAEDCVGNRGCSQEGQRRTLKSLFPCGNFLLQFFKPVQHDVDLSRRLFAGLDHQKTLPIRRHVVSGTHQTSLDWNVLSLEE